jgi:beta-glucosidase
VRFTLDADDLAFHRADMTWGAEPGEFEIFVGTSSDDVKSARFTLTGEAKGTRRVATR